jgi:branched-chain amino acid transport system permease protein
MAFFLSLFIEGALAGALYALAALAFVAVYKASRVINFALGEWLMLAALLVATGLHAFALDVATAMAMGCVGMFIVAILFSILVLRHMVGKPPIAWALAPSCVGWLNSCSLVFRAGFNCRSLQIL